jgi:transposase InsO family protein
VDDFSRITYLYLMKERSELKSVFKTFFMEVKNQFDTCIKIFRSDNAREYFHGQLSQFLDEHGIIHQSSCSRTPQQNGVAERKIRHLSEVMRALLFQMQVPKSYWSDAVLTACYLINRMPSTVLGGQVPHAILFPGRSLHPLPPRVFGCTCYVHVLDPNMSKLDPRSFRCIFLGYSHTQKGYRCYSPTLRRHFVCADVTFNESLPYYSTPVSTHDLLTIESVLPMVVPTGTVPQHSMVVPPPVSQKPLQVYVRRSHAPAPALPPLLAPHTHPPPSQTIQPTGPSEPTGPFPSDDPSPSSPRRQICLFLVIRLVRIAVHR